MSERELVRDLADRLRHHLNQLCDNKVCVTPDHDRTRDLLACTDQWLEETERDAG